MCVTRFTVGQRSLSAYLAALAVALIKHHIYCLKIIRFNLHI